MKKTLAALAAALSLFSSTAFADGDASKFVVSVKKIELKDVSGNWVVLPVPAGAQADLLADEPLLVMTNDGSVPPATYVNFRITLSETVKFAGYDGVNKTKEGGLLVFGGTASKSSDMPRNEVKEFRQDAPTWNKEAEGLVSQRLDLDYQDRDEIMEVTGRRPFAKPVIVKPKSVIKVTMGLELKKSVRYAWPNYFSGIESTHAMYLLPPKEVSEVTVKSDSTTALTTGEAIEWSF